MGQNRFLGFGECSLDHGCLNSVSAEVSIHYQMYNLIFVSSAAMRVVPVVVGESRRRVLLPASLSPSQASDGRAPTA